MYIAIINAVLPIILIMLLGFVLKKGNILSDSFLDKSYFLVYKLFLPILMFLQIATINSFEQFEPSFLIFVGAMVIISVIISALHAYFLKDSEQKSVVIQGAFNSNFLLLGIPLINSLFPESALTSLYISSIVFIPLVNFLSILVMTKDKTNKKFLLGFLKNPLFIAGMFGLLFLLIKTGTGFSISSIKFVYSSLDLLAKITVGFGLLIIGAKFNISSLKKYRSSLLLGTYLKLIFIPFWVLMVFNFLGNHSIVNPSSNNYITLIMLFCTPVSIASVFITKELQGNEELSNDLVFVSTIVSLFSLIATMLILKDYIFI
jgi:predicted permease